METAPYIVAPLTIFNNCHPPNKFLIHKEILERQYTAPKIWPNSKTSKQNQVKTKVAKREAALEKAAFLPTFCATKSGKVQF